MFNLFNGLLLIGLCSRLIVAGSLGGNGGGGGHHGKGIGYSIFTKHEIPIHHHHEWKSHEGFMGGEGGFAGQSGDAGSEGGHYHHHEDFHQYPKYKYEYGVKDLKTGDIKDQWEMRDGDYVKGITLNHPFADFIKSTALSFCVFFSNISLTSLIFRSILSERGRWHHPSGRLHR